MREEIYETGESGATVIKTEFGYLNVSDIEKYDAALRRYGSRLLASVMANRGIDAVPRPFVALPKPSEGFGKDIEKASEMLEREMTENGGSGLVIHTDYDADGILGASILSGFLLEKYGVEVDVDMNTREQGYSMTLEKVEAFFRAGKSLIVTIDKGIADVEAVRRAKDLGMSIVVTDHHVPKNELPPADAIVDWCVSGGPRICGAATAFWLARQMDEIVAAKYDVLAGVATIVDMVPLDDEVNRLIAARALNKINKGIFPNRSVEAFVERTVSRYGRTEYTYEDFGFSIGPVINTAGRNDLGVSVVRLLSHEAHYDEKLIETLNLLNEERKRVVHQCSVDLDAFTYMKTDSMVSYLIDADRIEPSYSGLVATMKSSEKGKITIVGFKSGDGTVRGSIRSGDVDFNLQNIFRVVDGIKGGGHAKAVGFSCPDVSVFDSLCEYLGSVDLVPEEKKPDFIILRPDLVDLSEVEKLDMMSPYGVGNPQPTAIIEMDTSATGAVRTIKGRHIKISYGGAEAMLFNIVNAAEVAKAIRSKGRIALYGEVGSSEFGGVTRLSVNVRDVIDGDWPADPSVGGPSKGDDREIG